MLRTARNFVKAIAYGGFMLPMSSHCNLPSLPLQPYNPYPRSFCSYSSFSYQPTRYYHIHPKPPRRDPTYIKNFLIKLFKEGFDNTSTFFFDKLDLGRFLKDTSFLDITLGCVLFTLFVRYTFSYSCIALGLTGIVGKILCMVFL